MPFTNRLAAGLAAVATALVALGISPVPAAASAGEAPAGIGVAFHHVGNADATIPLIGHGYGHGRGMGQYGALGYAIGSATGSATGSAWSYRQILDHYYGNTASGQVAPDTPMTVDMTSRDGRDTVVVQERGALATTPAVNLGCPAGNACAVRIERIGSGTFRVSRGGTCSGGPTGWVVVGSAVAANAVTVHPSVAGSDDRRDMLQLCEDTDTRWLRGDIVAQDTGTAQATVNSLPLDFYVRGVVPRESPASWGSAGNGAGEQALLAQAVAARSYGMAEKRWPFAKTCDTTSCQVYGGRAVQQSDGTFTDLEGTAVYQSSDHAVSATAGEVRMLNGAVARTEFSSSTGGYTAGGVFPAVVDAGDATPSNPNHDWSTDLATSDIEAAFGAGKGPLTALSVTARTGIGDLGGRVVSLSLQFQSGAQTVSGSAFAGAMGLKSDWFAVENTAALPYQVLTADGAVTGFGGADSPGSIPRHAASVSAVGLTAAPGGTWVLTSDGSVYSFGSAQSFGSLAGQRLNGPPHQIAGTPSGRGYWIVASDGGVFSFGDARFFGSTGGLRLNAPIVGMAPTPDGGGYWLLASDGGIFSFGDAHFWGSTGSLRLNAPVNAMAAMPDGSGYWLAASDGGIFTFGSARFCGSLPGLGVTETAAGMQPSPSGAGYLVVTTAGHVYGFGDAVAAGGPSGHAVGITITR
jgi:peptidoglycan hydrolase-like amidase